MARLRVLHGPSDHGRWESDGRTQMPAAPEYRPRASLLWGTAPPLTGSPLKCSAYLPCLGVLCHAGPFRVRATAAVSRAGFLVGCVTHSAQRSVCLLFSRLSSNWGAEPGRHAALHAKRQTYEIMLVTAILQFTRHFHNTSIEYSPCKGALLDNSQF